LTKFNIIHCKHLYIPTHAHKLIKTNNFQLYRIYLHILVYIILEPVYDNEKENWRILTNNEIYAMVKEPTITETIS